MQPLFSSTKEGWRSASYSGPASPELHTCKVQVQGLVCHDISERCLFSHSVFSETDKQLFRFAFGGKVFQFQVLPFVLALAPRTFTKCMDTALGPLTFNNNNMLNLYCTFPELKDALQ